MANTRVTNPVTGFNSATEEGLKLPSGTNANQPSGVQGMLRNDTGENTGGSASAIEHHNGTNWQYFAATESADPVVPLENFNTVLYTGSTSPHVITSVGFQPDLIWIKNRDTTDSSAIVDSVRGITSPTPYIASNTSDAQATSTNMPTSVQLDGFTITGNGGRTNTSGEDYVAWCFKAGGAAVANTDGDITSQVSANVAAGFSIVSWSGDGSDMDIGHGLDAAPEMVIRKNLISSVDWMVDTSVIDGSWDYLKLNTTGSKTNHTYVQSPTSTVFNTMGANYNSSGMIAYCFHSVPGYSKVGSFVGTGAAGLKIDLDFEPAYILTKRTSTSGGGWYIIDNKRSTASDKKNYLQANSNAAEATSSSGITFNTDGFTFNGSSFNTSGATHMYYAIA